MKKVITIITLTLTIILVGLYMVTSTYAVIIEVIDKNGVLEIINNITAKDILTNADGSFNNTYYEIKNELDLTDKEANILLDSQGHYVISDFGLSHRVFSLFKSYDKTITIPLASYMSPERCCLNGKVDTYSDIWSLGVSIYELFTGEIPFNGCGGELQLSDNITTLQCNKGSIELRNLIDACISICPQNRPSAREIIALADAIIAGCDNAPLFDVKSDCTIFRQTESFHNI